MSPLASFVEILVSCALPVSFDTAGMTVVRVANGREYRYTITRSFRTAFHKDYFCGVRNYANGKTSGELCICNSDQLYFDHCYPSEEYTLILA